VMPGNIMPYMKGNIMPYMYIYIIYIGRSIMPNERQ